MSWEDPQSGWGTVDHDSWYLVAAVPGTPFNLDEVRGGDATSPPGDGPAQLVVQSVPDVSLSGMLCPVSGGLPFAGELNDIDPRFFDVPVDVTPNDPSYFTEAGHNDPARRLIAGLQIVYAAGSTPPLYSDNSVWLPARDPADPAGRVAAVRPWGATGSTTVSVPTGTPKWLGARIVYHDATVNGDLGAVADELAPRLVSLVGKSCGPAVEVYCEPPVVTEPRGDLQICPGEVTAITGVAFGCPGDTYVCSWEREGVPFPAAGCLLADSPATATNYRLTTTCSLVPCFGLRDFTVLVEDRDANPVGNRLRMARRRARLTDIDFSWPNTVSRRYNVRHSDARALDRPSSSLHATVASQLPTVTYRAIDEMTLAPAMRSYGVFAVGCDNLEEP